MAVVGHLPSTNIGFPGTHPSLGNGLGRQGSQAIDRRCRFAGRGFPDLIFRLPHRLGCNPALAGKHLAAYRFQTIRHNDPLGYSAANRRRLSGISRARQRAGADQTLANGISALVYSGIPGRGKHPTAGRSTGALGIGIIKTGKLPKTRAA